MVASAFITNPLNKKLIYHKDGDFKNNHISNLEWRFPSEITSENINLDGEIGKDIPKWGGVYQASSFGRIKSLIRKKFNSRKEEIIISPRLDKGRSFYAVNLNDTKRCERFRVDYLIVTTFLDNIKNKPVIRHLDGNLQNNYLNNLKWDDIHRTAPEGLNTDSETWKQIPDYPDYLVSSLGKIFVLERISSLGEFLPEGFLKPTNSHGYLSVWLSKNNKWKQFRIHRLVASAFIENPNNLPKTLHKNDIRTDNRVENLYHGTMKQNYEDAKRNGRLNMSKGEDHYRAKLKEDDVRLIRMLYNSGMFTQIKIAQAFKVSKSTIKGAIDKIYWKHVN